MAKGKSKSVEPKVEPVKEEVKVEAVEVIEAPHEDFVSRKLKAINSMENSLKAQTLANRLLRKARN